MIPPQVQTYMRKRFGTFITIANRRYRRFVHCHPMLDGWSRCTICGQINEPEHHNPDACKIARTGKIPDHDD